jgi:hypothetical protein
MTIVVISDACLGYGSPQIPALVEALENATGLKSVIFEPAVDSSPPKHELYPQFKIVRVQTANHVYERGGRAEYLEKVATAIDKLNPEIVIPVCTFCLPVLLHLKKKPKYTIYYAIESIIQYGIEDVYMNRSLHDAIDYIIWPEENRARLDSERCQLTSVPMSIVLNSSNPRESAEAVLPIHLRKRRIIHQGTIGKEHTYSHYFLDRTIARLPIDAYGPLVDEPSQAFNDFSFDHRHLTGSRGKGLIYHGRVDLNRLAFARQRSAFLVCIWNPINERGKYAPSNKFFEAVADGIPPITAPHPQHVRLVEKYNLGIVMDGWDFKSFRKALLLALRSWGTPQYHKWVENCQRAVRNELCREMQFDLVAERIGRHRREKLGTQLEDAQ